MTVPVLAEPPGQRFSLCGFAMIVAMAVAVAVTVTMTLGMRGTDRKSRMLRLARVIALSRIRNKGV